MVPVTASAVSFLSLIRGSEAPASATDAVTWPAATSAMDCGLFRYGTWATSKANRWAVWITVGERRQLTSFDALLKILQMSLNESGTSNRFLRKGRLWFAT